MIYGDFECQAWDKNSDYKALFYFSWRFISTSPRKI